MDHQIELLASKISISKDRIKQLTARISALCRHLIQQSTTPSWDPLRPAIFDQQLPPLNKKFNSYMLHTDKKIASFRDRLKPLKDGSLDLATESQRQLVQGDLANVKKMYQTRRKVVTTFSYFGRVVICTV